MIHHHTVLFVTFLSEHGLSFPVLRVKQFDWLRKGGKKAEATFSLGVGSLGSRERDQGQKRLTVGEGPGDRLLPLLFYRLKTKKNSG